MVRSDVLVVGAGPTGLVLALWLAKLGVKVRIIDKSSGPGLTSRAVAVQARTLELYRQLELADTVVAEGHQVPAVNLWVRGQSAARVPFEAIGSGLTPYPFLQIFPQDQHERLLVERLELLNVRVDRQTELIGFVDEGERVIAKLRTADNSEVSCEASFLAGCDGAHSIVRETLGTGYPGGTYRQLFYVADVEAEGPSINGELHVDLDDADFLAVFPLSDGGRARLIGTIRNERAEYPDGLKFEDVSQRAIEHVKLQVKKVNWFSTYHVHHRVTEHFRKGRAFLLGDAAHVHSPVGGQGMNTGIGDAINLAWKLTWVVRGSAADRLLDSFEPERIEFARRLVATTDRIFSFVAADGRIAEIVRTRVAPFLIPTMMHAEFAREYLFKTVSQIMLNYRNGPLAAGTAGTIHGGDRLPWVTVGGSDNFASLVAMTWQVHVYGAARPDLAGWCEAHNVPLHVFAWQQEYAAAGFARDALYLIRPDTYIGLADASGAASTVEHYFAEREIRTGGSQPP